MKVRKALLEMQHTLRCGNNAQEYDVRRVGCRELLDCPGSGTPGRQHRIQQEHRFALDRREFGVIGGGYRRSLVALNPKVAYGRLRQ